MKSLKEFLAENTAQTLNEDADDALFNQISKAMDIIRVGSKLRKAMEAYEKSGDKDALAAIKKAKSALDAASEALVNVSSSLPK
ncbi:hypothetical protein CPT_Merlin159 [Citrobacter phage Merlin]|uniref:Uncharacterized protein n=1 Tax=Citrobacter phage Merlin TaxID=1675602 RepID=A0A0K1LNS0_9CAUD|nr:hypothetical protein CPT_Merlin159 [Citrobacter phage Merlin]AKU43805.1 hypothetical protein CPT_Merlin159 [Citrobacter phage Merlin]